MNNKIFKKIIFFSIFSNQVKAFKIFDKEINPKLIIGKTLFIGCAGFVYKKFKDQKYLLENDLNLKKDTIKKL